VLVVSTSKVARKKQVKLDQTCTQANILAAFPLATARDRRWWSHWRSLSADTSTSFFVWPLKRGGGRAIHTSGLNCHWLKVVIALEVVIFLAFCGPSFCGCRTSLSGGVFIVALSKCVHNCWVPHHAQAFFVPGAQSQAIWPTFIVSQADRLQSGEETNAGQWPLEDGVDGWMPWECIYYV